MTIFGIDISNNQGPNLSMADVAAEGFDFVFCKVSQGDYYADYTWPIYRQAAGDVGLICVGYHYADSSCTPIAQVAAWKANSGGDVAMIDWEDDSGTIEDYWALVDAFNEAGVYVALSYIPNWYWQQDMGLPDLTGVPGLISSNYSSMSGYAYAIYEDYGGDAGPGWEPYGGVTPTIWQFTDQGSVGGNMLDCNAFRGTPALLTALLQGTGGDVTPQQAQQLQDIWDQLRGPAGNGWPQLGTDTQGHNLTPVDALAALIADVEALKAAQ